MSDSGRIDDAQVTHSSLTRRVIIYLRRTSLLTLIPISLIQSSGCGSLLKTSNPLNQSQHQSSLSSTIQKDSSSLEVKDSVTDPAAPVDSVEPSVGQDQLIKTKHTQLLQVSGDARIGEPMPFFSGWLTTGQILTLPKLLKKKRKRYVITMCTSWCQPCLNGLQALSKSKDDFQRHDIELVIYVIDTKREAKKIDQRFKFDWAYVLIDEFKVHAYKLSSSKNSTLKKTIELPKTFVLNSEGNIEIIIGQEGEDFIDLLLSEGDL